MRPAPLLSLLLLTGSLALVGTPASAAAVVVVPVTTATIVHEPWNGLNELDPWVAAEGPDEVQVVGYPAVDPWRLTFDIEPPGAKAGEPGDGYELEFQLPSGHTFEERRYAWGHAGDPDTDVRPTIYASVGSMGCDAAGEITVHEMTPDLSRLWVTFKLWCNRPDAVSYGEIRINTDAATTGGLVAPALADWPNADVGETAEVARWAIQNPSDAPVSLGRPFVTGSHASDFVAGPPDCTIVPAGGRCPIPVVFTPGGAGPRNAVLHVPVGRSDGELTVELRGAGVGGGVTSIEEYLSNEHGAWYGLYGPSAHVYAGNTNHGNGVYVAATNPLGGVSVTPPRGETLEVGRRYTDVEWSGPEDGVGSLGASVMTSNDCEDYIAEFTVHELTYGPSGKPASVSLSYDILCTNWNDEGRDHVERGAYAWRAAEAPPRVVHPPLPPEPPTPLPPSPPPPERPVVVVSSDRPHYRRGARAVLAVRVAGTARRQKVDLRIRRRGDDRLLERRISVPVGVVKVREMGVHRDVIVRAKLAREPWSSAQRLVLRVRRAR